MIYFENQQAIFIENTCLFPPDFFEKKTGRLGEIPSKSGHYFFQRQITTRGQNSEQWWGTLTSCSLHVPSIYLLLISHISLSLYIYVCTYRSYVQFIISTLVATTLINYDSMHANAFVHLENGRITQANAWTTRNSRRSMVARAEATKSEDPYFWFIFYFYIVWDDVRESYTFTHQNIYTNMYTDSFLWRFKHKLLALSE